MRYLVGFIAVLALSVMGCSETTGTGGSAGEGGSAGVGGEGGAGATAGLSLLIVSYPPATQEPLEGVEICQTDTDNCVSTNANGNAVIQLPYEKEVSFTLDREGYGSYLDSYVLPAQGAAEVYAMATVERFADQYALIDSPYPEQGTGTVLVGIPAGTPGVTFTLVESTGKQFYREENLDWNADLTATTTGGGGGFAEVAPGVVQVDIAGADCSVLRGWSGDQANRVKLPVKSNYFSRLTTTCEAQ
jgi:hypothetical protein